MTTFQLLMLIGSAYFAFRIYEHIQTLQDPEQSQESSSSTEVQNADAFSPFSADDLVQKADEAFEDGDMKKALAFLLEANIKEPQGSEVLFKIGYILQDGKDFDEAMKYYKQALELDKNNEYIHNSIASLYRENGEYVSAKMHLTESLEIDDQNSVTYYNYGNLLVDMNHFDEAKTMYSKAIEINPDFTEAKEELEKLS